MSGRQAVQLGITAVGVAVGAYFHQPQLGLALGSVLGAVVANAVFPLDPVVNRQENLADLAVTSAAIGQFKPIIYGTWPVGGNIIWAYPKVAIEHSETTEAPGGGKGGFGGQQTVTIYTTYRQHMMVALCEGPVSRITRIYYDATLVYDEAQPAGWTVTRGYPNGDPDFSQGDTEPDTIIYEKAGAESLQKFVLFRGTETQEPWAFAEALENVGEGTLPAYRGTAVVGVTLDVGTTGRLPNLRIEVTTTVSGLGTPLAVHFLPKTQTLWSIWHQGAKPLYGPGMAIQYSTRSVSPIRYAALTRYGEPAVRGDRRPIATGTGQTPWGDEAIMVQRFDSTIAVMGSSGRLIYDRIDPRTEAEQEGGEDVTPPGAGAITTRPSPLGNKNLRTTLVYALPGVISIGQCDIRRGEPETFQRLVVSGVPHRIVWNGAAAAVYVSCPEAGVVERITAFNPLAIAESISVGTSPTALLVASTGDCWATDRDGNAVYRFTTGSDLSPAVTVGAAPDSITEASDGFVWVANTGALSVSRIDPSDLSVETFTLPSAPTQVLGAATDGACWVTSTNGRSLYLVATDGTYDALGIPRGPASMALDHLGQCWVVCEIARTIVRANPDGLAYAQEEIANSLACVVRDINLRAGMPPEWVDVSGLDSTPVHYPIFGSATAASALEDLALAFQFFAVETGSGLGYLFKGGTPVAAINEAATLPLGENGQGSLTIERAQPQEIPTEVTVIYRSPGRHFHTDEQTVQKPHDGPRIPVQQQIAAGFDDTSYAKQLAEILLYEPVFARYAATLQLPPQAARLEPGDLVTLTTSDSAVYDLRLTKVTTGPDNRVEWDTIRHRSYLYENFESFPSEVLSPGTPAIPVAAPVELLIVEAPPHPDDQEGVWILPPITRKKTGAGGDFFPLVSLYESTDNEASYHFINTLSVQSVIGDIATATPAAPAHAWDYATTIDVVLRPGTQALTAGTQEAPHYAMVGQECIAYTEVELIALRTYRLRALRRGALGTEQQITSHVANEMFTLLTPSLRGRRHVVGSAAVGTTHYYKAVPQGSNIAAVTGVAHTIQGISGKPWAPVLLDVVRDVGSGDYTITWWHRSRTRGDWEGFSGIDYDTDDLTSYALTLYNSPFFTPAAMVTTRSTGTYSAAEGTRTFMYTADMQTEDFGSPQSVIRFGLASRVQGIAGYQATYQGGAFAYRPIWLATFAEHVWPPGDNSPVWVAPFTTQMALWAADFAEHVWPPGSNNALWEADFEPVFQYQEEWEYNLFRDIGAGGYTDEFNLPTWSIGAGGYTEEWES